MKLERRQAKILELIDTPDISDDDFVSGYQFRDRVLRSFGIYRSMASFLKQASSHWAPHQPVTFLELYCGLGGLSRYVATWGRKNGFDIRVLAVDCYGRIIDLAKENNPPDSRLLYDVRDWNHSAFLEAQQVDYVMSFLALHRLPESEAVPFIRRAEFLAKRGLFLMDWLRTRQAWIALKAAAQFSLDRSIRHDAPLSVSRSYSPAEIERLMREAGIDYLTFKARLGIAAIICGERGLVLAPALNRVTGLAT